MNLNTLLTIPKNLKVIRYKNFHWQFQFFPTHSLKRIRIPMIIYDELQIDVTK